MTTGHYIYEAEYAFGDEILQNGKLFLPLCDGGVVPIDDPVVDRNIQKEIGHLMLTNPMSMLLSKTLDLYIPVDGRHVLYSLVKPGNVFGVWQLLDDFSQGSILYTPLPMWDMTAGGRSLFMLPRISDKFAYGKLKKSLV